MDKVPAYEKRVINEITKGEFNSLLSTTDWSEVYRACDQGDPSSAYSVFIEKYKALYEYSFPKTNYSPKKD